MTHFALDAAISPLRQRLIDDMNVRRSHNPREHIEPAHTAAGTAVLMDVVLQRARVKDAGDIPA